MSEVIQGIDVSSHQGDSLDFQLIREHGFRFCVCKCTEGADFQDPKWSLNMRKIQEINDARGNASFFYPGAYHFARPDNRVGRNGGETEGRWFSRVLNSTTRDLGFSIGSDFIEPALDFEKYSESDYRDNIPWIEGFLHVLQEETGRSGMIYTGRNIWRYEVGDTDNFVNVPLWQVQYSISGAEPEAVPSRMPYDTSKEVWSPTLWQWSGGGDYAYYSSLYGPIPGAGIVDVNRLYGGQQALEKLALASVAVQTPPDPIFPPPPPVFNLVDLRGSVSTATMRVQSLLLAHGYGPQGLVNSQGFPDGLSGSKTEEYLRQFKKANSLPDDTVVDWQTWWLLLLSD
jgi:lysozyme